MGTAIYESAAAGITPDFELDADLQYTETHEWETTERKVEAKGVIADFVSSKPAQYSVEGKVTAMRINDLAPADPQKLVNTKQKLVEIAKKMQIVTVVSELHTGPLMIVRVEAAKGVSDGKSIQLRIGFKEIETTQTATTTVPASKLRSKVARKAATGKKGGAAKGSATTGKAKTALLSLANLAGIAR